MNGFDFGIKESEGFYAMPCDAMRSDMAADMFRFPHSLLQRSDRNIDLIVHGLKPAQI